MSLSISRRGIDDIGIKLFYNGAHCEYLRFQQDISPEVISMRTASFFFGVNSWLVKVLGQFSIIYFRGLGLRIGVRVRVSVVLWSE